MIQMIIASFILLHPRIVFKHYFKFCLWFFKGTFLHEETYPDVTRYVFWILGTFSHAFNLINAIVYQIALTFKGDILNKTEASFCPYLENQNALKANNSSPTSQWMNRAAMRWIFTESWKLTNRQDVAIYTSNIKKSSRSLGPTFMLMFTSDGKQG